MTSYVSSASYSGHIKGENVNVRSKPTTSARLITTLSNKKVTVISSSGSWSKVSCGKVKGWVKNDFIESKNSSSKSTASSAGSKYVLVIYAHHQIF
jgi:uncharacterized protein YgiM (DUF1202 family)